MITVTYTLISLIFVVLCIGIMAFSDECKKLKSDIELLADVVEKLERERKRNFKQCDLIEVTNGKDD